MLIPFLFSLGSWLLWFHSAVMHGEKNTCPLPVLNLLPPHSLNETLLLHEQWCSIPIISRSFIILQTCIASLLIISLSKVNNSNLCNFSDIWKFFWAFAQPHYPSTNSFSSAVSSQRSPGWYHILDSGQVPSIALETDILREPIFFFVLFFISSAFKTFSECASFSAITHGNFLH